MNSPVWVHGQLIGQEGGIPVLPIDELTYIPKLTGSTPRRATTASASSYPTTMRHLFRGHKRKSDDAADDAKDHPSEAWPSSLSKHVYGNAGPNTHLHKLLLPQLKLLCPLRLPMTHILHCVADSHSINSDIATPRLPSRPRHYQECQQAFAA